MARIGKAGASTVAVVAGILVAAPSASALVTHGLQTTEVSPGVYAGTAECPPGTRVVSGGFETADQGYATVNRAQGKHGWFAKALDTTSLTVYANCSARFEISRASKRVRFPPESSGVERTAVARCEHGKSVSGGWAFAPAGGEAENQPVFKSRRRGSDRWAVTAFDDSGEARDRLKAFVYCLRRVQLAVHSALSFPIGEDQSGSRSAACDPGQELLGGGFSTSPESDFQNATGPDFFYSGSLRDGPLDWEARAHNYSNVAGTLTVTAICRR